MGSTTMRRLTIIPHLTLVFCIIAVFCVASAAQDDKNVWNEYRATATTAMPVTDKLFLWQYTGYFLVPERKQNTLAISPPGIMYRVRPWMEVWLGVLPSYTDNYKKSNSWEVRGVAGIRFAIPNKRKLNLYSFTRYEYKAVNQDGNMQSIPRFRSRIGLDTPIQRGDKRWAPHTFYSIADFEPIWRLDDKYLEKLRLRGGAGYIINKKLAVELIYHAEWAAPKGEPKKYVGNLWRINFKIALPRPGFKGLIPRVDVDE